MAEHENEEPLKLEQMTTKQRQKEFKATQKELRSKDEDKRSAAWEKLRTAAYLSEGGCLPVLLQTIAPKPKTVDSAKRAVTFLADLLSSHRETDSEHHPALVGLLAVLGSEVELPVVFAGLVDCLLLREPEKKKKKPSKNAPVESEQPESAVFVELRSEALRAFYLLFLPFANTQEKSELRVALSRLPGLFEALLAALETNFKAFSTSDTLQLPALQSCVYASNLLAWIVLSSSESVNKLIEHPVATHLSRMSENTLLCVPVCKLLHFASQTDEGLDFVAREDNASLAVGLLESSQRRFAELLPPPEETDPKKAKDAKKDNKKNDKKPVVVEKEPDPLASLDHLQCEESRRQLVQLQLMLKTLANIAEHRPVALTKDFVVRVAIVTRDCLLLPALWSESAAHRAPLDEPLATLSLHAVRLIGLIAEINNLELRSMLRKEGAVSLLWSLLLQSEQVIAAREDEQRQLDDALDLRRLAEKALLAVFLDRGEPAPTQIRFRSAAQFVLAADAKAGLDEFSQKNLLALQSQNADVVQRGLRVLAAVCTAVCEEESLSVLLDTKISAEVSMLCGRYAELVLQDKRTHSEIGKIANPCDVGDCEALCFSLIVVAENMLSLGAEKVIAFFEKNRIERLVDCLRLGPVPGDNERAETEVSLFDPRWFSWALQPQNTHPLQVVRLRPLVVDALRIVVQADQRFRVFEPQPDSAPAKAPPLSSCVCEEQAHMTIKLATDSVCALLALCARWCACGDRLIVRPAGVESLSDELRQSALLFFGALGLCGATAIDGALSEMSLRMCSGGETACRALVDFFAEKGAALDPAQAAQRILYFTDAGFSPSDSVLSVQRCGARPSLWAHLTVVGALLSVLNDSESSATSLALCVRALSSLTHIAHTTAPAQPVVADVFCVLLIALGGAVSLTALSGRHSKLSMTDRETSTVLLMHWISRGSCRETFWRETEKAQRAQVIDTKGGKKKEEDKKAKKNDKNAPPVVCVFPATVYHTECTEEFPDPNRGPSLSLWKTLLDGVHECAHMHSQGSTVLITGVQVGLGQTLTQRWLHEQDVDVDIPDENGCTALMYALLLGDERSVDALVAKKANVDAVDASGSPLVLYALSTLSDRESIALCGFISRPSFAEREISGSSMFLAKLIDSGVDVNVCDAAGCSPLLFALGVGSLRVSMGGNTLALRRLDLKEATDLRIVETDVRALLYAGANVNHCSRTGYVAMHVACAVGDVRLVDALLEARADPNALDKQGWHSLHHLLACCPEDTFSVLHSLLRVAQHKPATQTAFWDGRTGLSMETKLETELSMYFETVICEAFAPTALSAPRLSPADLLLLETEGGFSPALLCAAGRNIPLQLTGNSVMESKERRIKVLLHLLDVAEKECVAAEIAAHKASFNFSLLHATSLLLRGESDKLELSEKQKRSKRILYYDSLESELMAKVLSFSSIDLPLDAKDFVCELHVASLSPFASQWTPFHAAIAYGNRDQLDRLLRVFGSDSLAALRPAVIMSRLDKEHVSLAMAQYVIDFLSSRDDLKAQLNEPDSLSGERPIHLSVLSRQHSVTETLCVCNRLDINARSPMTELTVVQLVCSLGDMLALQAMKAAKDRIDLTLSLPDRCLPRRTCIDLVLLDSRRFDVFSLLADWRRNDVVQLLLAESDTAESLLKQLQRDDENNQDCGRSAEKSLLAFAQALISSTHCFDLNEQ